MLNTIFIKKGLDLPVDGAAEMRVTDARCIAACAVKPTDFVGLVPKLLVEEGAQVAAGDVLFCDKRDSRIRFTSPVMGRVKAVVRGEKRLLLAVVVEKDPAPAAEAEVPGETLKEQMLQCGLWTMLRQRPFGTVADPDAQPKAIFVSAFDSAPLAPDYDFVMRGREDQLVKGLEALATLTDGLVHVCFRPGQRLAELVNSGLHSDRIRLHYVAGPHPAGNIGTQIAAIDPINKGEKVWTMNIQDVATLGILASTGCYRPDRLVAVAGPQAKNPHYYRVMAGAQMTAVIAAQMLNPDYPMLAQHAGTSAASRIISGNMLSGTQIAPDGYLGAYDSLLTILPEGNYYDFMGWLMPGIRKFSFSRTFLSGFLPKSTFKPMGIEIPRLAGFWKFDTNTHGDVRPLVFTGNFERVFPFDIYPTQLIKACIIGDIELQENLGIYEVEPEDFALCEFIDTSKTDIQPVIREALEKLRKEAL